MRFQPWPADARPLRPRHAGSNRQFFIWARVKTTRQLGWDTLGNGELLRVAEEAGFDVLLPTDKNLGYQQNLKGRKIAIVVLGRNRWRIVKAALPHIVSAVNGAIPGSYVIVDVPDE